MSKKKKVQEEEVNYETIQNEIEEKKKEFETEIITSKNDPDMPEDYPKDSLKHKTFLRLAKPRTQKILDAFRILGNCSNKSSYEYTIDEIEKIFDTIGITMQETKDKFTAIAHQKELFEF